MDTSAFVPSAETGALRSRDAATAIDGRHPTGDVMVNGAVAYAEAPGADTEALTWRARTLIASVCAGGATALVWSGSSIHTSSRGWTTFAILGAAAAIAHLFPVRMRSNNAFSMAPAFVLPGIFLLPLPLALLLPVVQLLPAEALKDRYRWYIVSFNISNWTLDLLAAWAVTHAIRASVHGGLGFALAGFVAATTLIVLNHVFLSLVLSFARGYSIRSTGLLTVGGLANEGVLGIVGVCLAAFWNVNPWLVPLALAPLFLIQRSLTVESLKEEARVDAKTGLFNARHFAAALSEEIARAERFGRPLTLIMADLDLLRDINNSYGHLAGDAVLAGLAETFRAQLRHYDVPARFGGEEFSILLPETPFDQGLEIAERIRRAVAAREFEVETSEQPIHATVSLGVASYPKDASDANELIHQADVAVYRAKLQGRNRVLSASAESVFVAPDRSQRLVAVPPEPAPPAPATAAFAPPQEPVAERNEAKPHLSRGPRFLALSMRLGMLVGAVSFVGVAVGVAGVVFGRSTDWTGLITVVLLVGVGQALALEYDDGDGSISVSAVGALAGAAIIGPRAALALALTIALVEWSARRQSIHEVVFNVGLLSLATTAAALIFTALPNWHGTQHRIALALTGLVAGVGYYLVNTGLVSLALAVQGHDRWLRVFRERFAWLLLHYVSYGFIGGVMALAYESVRLPGLVVFAVPLLLMRKTQEAYLKHTQKSAQKLRRAAETIQSQNVSLEQANRLLKERSTAAMESLSATVDARDSYTAGHSRRVQQLSLAIGRELGLSQAELDLLGHAALFHDIGKLAIPDAILLKPASLTEDEWVLMQRHADEGARIIDRLGFLQDAVPSIRHHHECWDGTGYPDRLRGEEIPLGARIIHVADALDSMLTTRIYRAARPVHEALEELRRQAGTQFCPRCVTALERILPEEGIPGIGVPPAEPPLLATVAS
jgi:diguanylate cyclase (GGDEF)-like protein/putative nucleotidyltransferase with HDIG domain